MKLMTWWRVPVSMLMLTMLAACSSAPAERRMDRLDRFEAAAGEPVKSFHFFTLYNWESLGSDRVAIWTRPSEAYLLALDGPCRELNFAHTIGLTSSVNQVHSKFDSVLVKNQRCRITQIRPVDPSKLRVGAEPAA